MQKTSQVQSNQQPLLQSICNAKYTIEQIDDTLPRYESIITGAISNNLKYIIAGGTNKYLKIWKNMTNQLLKSIQFDCAARTCKFTDDSQLLYVGIAKKLYQFSVNNLFKKICCKNMMHTNKIGGIYCITKTMTLTYSEDIIIKTDFERKQQLLQIQGECHINGINELQYKQNLQINGLDYNKSLNLIASASFYIKLWNGDKRLLIIEKKVADNLKIRQSKYYSQLIKINQSVQIIPKIQQFRVSIIKQNNQHINNQQLILEVIYHQFSHNNIS